MKRYCINANLFFTITAEILARSLANFHFQYTDRHRHEFIRHDASASESGEVQQWISSWHCQSSLRNHSAIASRIHSYFDNVIAKFIVNNKTDAWKTDVNLLTPICRRRHRLFTRKFPSATRADWLFICCVTCFTRHVLADRNAGDRPWLNFSSDRFKDCQAWIYFFQVNRTD